MPTTCPRCGTGSPETSECCRECGRDLYRVSYPAPTAAFPFNLRPFRGPVRLTASVALLVIGTGVGTGLLLQGGDDEVPVSKDRLPATAVPRAPTPTPEPSTPKPSKTKKPKPAPTTTPPPSTPSAKPTKKQPPGRPLPGIPEAERALELADKLTKQWGHPGNPHWERR
jgi:hypothetical protein